MTRFDGVLSDVIAHGFTARFRAAGDSMHPSIRSGEHLHVVPAEELRVGDVILARASRGLTAHRIVRIEGARIVMRGDNALRSDGAVDREAVVGRVAAVERDGRCIPIHKSHSPVLRRVAALGRRVRRALAQP